MTTQHTESHSGREAVPAYILPYAERESAVSLIEIWQALARRKLIILAALILSLIAAIWHIYTTQPIYTASIRLQPPEIEDIKALLLGEPETWMLNEGERVVGYNVNKSLLDKYGMDSITPMSVFEAYIRNYHSAMVRREFTNGNNNLNFNISGLDNKNQVAIASVTHHDPEYAANQLSMYVKFIDEYTALNTTDNIRNITQIELNKLKREVAIKRQYSFDTNQDIAKVGVNEAGRSVSEKGRFSAKDLELLHERIAYLESLSIDPAEVSIIRIDSTSDIPVAINAPNKKRILLLAAAAGLFLGILAAFFFEFIAKLHKNN